MDLGDLLVGVLVFVGVTLLLGASLIGFVMWRYRIPPRGVVAMAGALVYVASPIDVLPEAILGPIGLVDDAGVVGLVTVWVVKLATARRVLREAGVRGRRPTRRAPEGTSTER